MTPRHWIKPEQLREVRAIWLAGNDFTMKEIGAALGLTERQVRYAVRSLPKSALQSRRFVAAVDSDAVG